jgi:hypothetical protein
MHMVKNLQRVNIDINHAVLLRREAVGLLRRLEKNREAAERVCAETGKRDAMRFVTGCSAIERAIETTRGMIRNMDHLLEDIAETYGDTEGDLTSNHAARTPNAPHVELEHLVESR